MSERNEGAIGQGTPTGGREPKGWTPSRTLTDNAIGSAPTGRPPAAPPPPPPTGAARFTRQVAPEQPRSPLATVGAVAALLALVVGVPALLLVLDGLPPVPTSLPTRATFTQPIGIEQILTLLVAVVWLAWLQFLVCLVVELRSALTGATLPRPVPLAGPTQRLARTLVSLVLLAGTVAAPVGAAVAATADAAPRDTPVAMQTMDVAASAATFSGVPLAAPTPAAPVEQAAPAAPVVPTADAALDGHLVYTVAAPVNGYHDNLWDIAERSLGDGRRYTEIYELNAGREQADGRQLELARLIQPGWQLVMPEDAVGVARFAVAAPAAPAAVTPEAPVETPAPPMQDASVDGPSFSGVPLPADGAGPAGGGPAVAPPAATGDPTPMDEAPSEPQAPAPSQAPAPTGPGSVEQPADERMDAAGSGLGGAGVAFGGTGLGALAAAGVVGALVRERRRRHGASPDGQAVEAEIALRIEADPERSRHLDQALRGLAAVCSRSGRPLPRVAGAIVDDETIVLVLSEPDTAAVAPWSPLDHGRRWQLERLAVGRASTSTPSGYPGLVSLGRDLSGRDVLVDLTSAGGPVCVAGSLVAARDVVTAWATDLAVNPWSDGARVSTFDLPESLAAVASGPGWRALGSPDDLRGDRLAGQVLLLGSPPPPQVLDRVLDGGPQGRGPAAVVVAGAVRDAAWTFTVDEIGTLSVPPLGVTVTANRLRGDAVQPLAGLFRSAREDPGGDRPAVPTPPREPDARAWATAPVRVSVLGPLSVEGAGDVEPQRRELLQELVAFLAVHGAVHPTVLAGAMWPRGVSADVRDATIARAREWLGSEVGGRYRLGEDAEGRLLLSDEVVADHAVMLSLLRRSRVAPTQDAERDLLRGALRLLRGEFLAGRPDGRYTWLARSGTERDVAVLVADAAERLALLETSAGDPSAAAAAATAGLRAGPAWQPLWRDLLVAIAEVNPDELPNAVSEMRSVLASARVDPDPETEALVEELLPGGR